jgi:hypothetical protein
MAIDLSLFAKFKRHIDTNDTSGMTQILLEMLRTKTINNLQRVEDWFYKHHPRGHVFAITLDEAKRAKILVLKPLLNSGSQCRDAFGKPTPYFAFTYLAPTETDLLASKITIGTSDQENYARLAKCGFLAIAERRR